MEWGSRDWVTEPTSGMVLNLLHSLTHSCSLSVSLSLSLARCLRFVSWVSAKWGLSQLPVLLFVSPRRGSAQRVFLKVAVVVSMFVRSFVLSVPHHFLDYPSSFRTVTCETLSLVVVFSYV